MATNGTTTNGQTGTGADTTHTQSQRYLSTRGEDSGVCYYPVLLNQLLLQAIARNS